MKKPGLILLSICLFSCVTAVHAMSFCKKKNKKKSTMALVQPVFVPGPSLIVYKTSRDFQQNVPVGLSEDKTTISSYPAPSDLKATSVPVQLAGGYLMDNRGIGENAAFTGFTYEQYMSLAKPPSNAELEQSIIEKDPIVEMYTCGLRSAFSEPEKQLNDIINAGKLGELCRKIK